MDKRETRMYKRRNVCVEIRLEKKYPGVLLIKFTYRNVSRFLL